MWRGMELTSRVSVRLLVKKKGLLGLYKKVTDEHLDAVDLPENAAQEIVSKVRGAFGK